MEFLINNKKKIAETEQEHSLLKGKNHSREH